MKISGNSVVKTQASLPIEILDHGTLFTEIDIPFGISVLGVEALMFQLIAAF